MNLNNVLIALKNASQFGLDFIKDFCLKFIIKESNFNHIVNSKDFESLDQPLMVEIIRRRQAPQQQRSITVMERDGSLVQIPATSPPCLPWSPGGGGLPFVSIFIRSFYVICSQDLQISFKIRRKSVLEGHIRNFYNACSKLLSVDISWLKHVCSSTHCCGVSAL